MVFNIEEGGVGVDLGKVVEAIRRADPDVVALQEAMGNTAPDRRGARLGVRVATDRSSCRATGWSTRPSAPARPGYVEVRPGRVRGRRRACIPRPSRTARSSSGTAAREGGRSMALERRVRLAEARAPLAGLPRLAAAGMSRSSWSGTSTRRRTWTGRRATVGQRPHVRSVGRTGPSAWRDRAAGFRDTWREIHPDPVADPG